MLNFKDANMSHPKKFDSCFDGHSLNLAKLDAELIRDNPNQAFGAHSELNRSEAVALLLDLLGDT